MHCGLYQYGFGDVTEVYPSPRMGGIPVFGDFLKMPIKERKIFISGEIETLLRTKLIITASAEDCETKGKQLQLFSPQVRRNFRSICHQQ
jgi:hypothetical protein